MKTSSYLVPVTAIIALIVLGSGRVRTESAGPWVAVEELYANWAKGEIDRVMDGLHHDFTGWRYDAPIPRAKEDVGLILHRYKALYHVSSYNIRPLAVRQSGDAAIVHLHYETTALWQGEREVEDAGRVTLFLIQEDDRWLVFGDHGGSLLKPPI